MKLLVPDGGGLTTWPAPPLVWQLQSGFRGTVKSSVTSQDDTGVVYEQTGAFPKGLYGLDLSRSDLELKVGTVYVWTVELLDGGQSVARSETLIERVAPDARGAAQAGIWFDVLGGFVSIDLSTRARVSDRDGLNTLLQAGGIAR